ncbi:uncharacterized protein LOC144581936 isoform X3 [Callithrix jacchus]
MAASAASQRSPRKWEKAISHMLHPTLTQPAARKTGLTPPCSPNDTKFISRQQMSKAENVPQSTSLSTKKIHRLTVPWLSHGASSSNPPPSKDIWSISAFLVKRVIRGQATFKEIMTLTDRRSAEQSLEPRKSIPKWICIPSKLLLCSFVINCIDSW